MKTLPVALMLVCLCDSSRASLRRLQDVIVKEPRRSVNVAPGIFSITALVQMPNGFSCSTCVKFVGFGRMYLRISGRPPNFRGRLNHALLCAAQRLPTRHTLEQLVAEIIFRNDFHCFHCLRRLFQGSPRELHSPRRSCSATDRPSQPTDLCSTKTSPHPPTPIFVISLAQRRVKRGRKRDRERWSESRW